jgi:hypothetical protein
MDIDIPFNKGAIRASDCISEGWSLIKDQFWLFFLFVTIGALIIGFIPILRWFVYGPMLVGAYYAVLRRTKGEFVSAEAFMKGFGMFLPAMIVGLIESLGQLLNDVVGIFVNGLSLLLQSLHLDKNLPGSAPPYGANNFAPTDELGQIFAGLVGLVLVIIVVAVVVSVLITFIWRITFMFALPLMADHPELTPIQAISLSAKAGWSNPGGIIVLIILQCLVSLAGVLALCIGVLFVIPIIVASDIAAYRMVFPESSPAPSIYNEPPDPQYYGSTFGQGT